MSVNFISTLYGSALEVPLVLEMSVALFVFLAK